MPVNRQVGTEWGPVIWFESTLNDLKGGSARAYLERQDTDGSFVRTEDEEYDIVYSGEDVWDEEDTAFGYNDFGPTSFYWKTNHLLYDYGRVVVDYTYPDGESGQWQSDPFHICSGSYTDEGEASYSAADRSVTIDFPVWEGIDPSAITLNSYSLMYWETWTETVPELVSLTGWKDSDGNAWLRVIVRCEEDLALGDYMFSIYPTIDTDPGNCWTDNAVADFTVTEASGTHTAPKFTLNYPFNPAYGDASPAKIRFSARLNDLKGGSAKATILTCNNDGSFAPVDFESLIDPADESDPYRAIAESLTYNGEDAWDVSVNARMIDVMRREWMGRAFFYGECMIHIDYTYPDGSSDQWESKYFHIGEGPFTLTGEGTYSGEDNLVTGKARLWDDLPYEWRVRAEDAGLIQLSTGKELPGSLLCSEGYRDDSDVPWVEICYDPKEALPAGEYRLVFTVVCDPDGNNPWTDQTYIGFTVE